MSACIGDGCTHPDHQHQVQVPVQIGKSAAQASAQTVRLVRKDGVPANRAERRQHARSARQPGRPKYRQA